MSHECSWCKNRIITPPVYYTQEFPTLQPGFEVYCSASCSLLAFNASPRPHTPIDKKSRIKTA